MKETDYDRAYETVVEGTADSEEVTATEAAGMETDDPFSPTNAPGFNLIVTMRVYDVLLALLREQNEEVAEQLVTRHAQGKLLGPLPTLDLES